MSWQITSYTDPVLGLRMCWTEATDPFMRGHNLGSHTMRGHTMRGPSVNY